MKIIIFFRKTVFGFVLLSFIGCSYPNTLRLNETERQIANIELPSLEAELELAAGFDRNNLGYVYSRIGNYYRWKGDYPRNLTYQEKALDAVGCVNCLIKSYIRSQVALSYYYLGYYQKAVSQLLSALDEMAKIDVDKLVILEGSLRESPYYIKTLIYTYLALNYYHGGDAIEAEKSAQEAVNSSYGYKRAEEYRLTMALGLRILGMIRIDKDEFREAIKYFQESLKILTEGSSETLRTQFHDIINNQKLYLARSYYLLKNYNSALKILSSVERPTHEFQWRAHLLKGILYQEQGQIAEAIVQFEKSIHEVERARAVLGRHGFKISFMNDKQEPYKKIIQALFKSGSYDQAFAYAEKAKARAFLDLLANAKNIGVKNQKTRALVKKEKALKEKESDLQAKLELDSLHYGQRHVDQSTALKVRGIQKELKALYEYHSNENIDFASIKTAHVLNVEAIRKLIGNDLTVIEYYYDDQNLYIWAFNSTYFKSIIKPLPSEGLKSEVINYRRALLDDAIQPSKTATQNLEISENRIFELLLGDFIAEINTSKIYIVPHGVLHYLPFNALKSESGYLIEKFQIGYVPSATAIKYVSAKRKEKEHNILALGNPDLKTPRLDLPGAEDEVRHLGKLFSNSKVLIQTEASEMNFKALAGRYPIIHIASHADFNPEEPLQSCLRLAASKEDDGRLTTREVFNIDLDAYLVTLSGCETGLGKITNGDEVTGLNRAFIYAGTPSILGSLWKVHDESTKILMGKFYLNLMKMDKCKALQLAQLDMLNDSTYNKPFFWAPFQITGDCY